MRLPPLFRIPDRRVSLLSGGLRPARRSAKDPRTGAREGQECSMSEPRPRQKQRPDQPRRAPDSGHRTGPFPRRMLRLPSARSSHALRRAVRALGDVTGHTEAGAGATAEARLSPGTARRRRETLEPAERPSNRSPGEDCFPLLGKLVRSLSGTMSRAGSKTTEFEGIYHLKSRLLRGFTSISEVFQASKRRRGSFEERRAFQWISEQEHRASRRCCPRPFLHGAPEEWRRQGEGAYLDASTLPEKNLSGAGDGWRGSGRNIRTSAALTRRSASTARGIFRSREARAKANGAAYPSRTRIYPVNTLENR